MSVIHADRRQDAGSATLGSFLNPGSIALFGASDDQSNLRGRITRLIAEKGFRGDYYLINPSGKEIGGRRCRASIKDVGVGVDLAIFVVPASQVLSGLEDCAALGVKNALILSSGFADGGGDEAETQNRIAELARGSGMQICGPNTVGFYNEIDKVAATFSPAIEIDPDEVFTVSRARVGVIAQSGGLGFSLYHRGRHLGLDFSTVVTTGNEVDLTAADFLSYIANDGNTCAILMFLETVRDGAAFVAALEQAAAARKPVVVVKVGRSAAAGRATVSHTGSLAGSDSAYDAMFARHGVTVAEDLGRAVAVIAGFVTNPLPRGRNAAIVTVSGGAGALAADRLTAAGFHVPELSKALQQDIAKHLPVFASTSNPVDVTGQAARTAAPLRAIKALNESAEVDLVVMASTMSRTIPPVDIDGLKDVLAQDRKPLFFYSYTLPSQFGLRALAQAGMVTYTALDDIAAAADAMQRYRSFLDNRATTSVPPCTRAHRLGRESGIIAEHEAKNILASHGIPIGRRVLLQAGDDVHRVPADFFPVAVKIQSPDIPHKTEAKGIRLHIPDRAALVEARDEILSAADKFNPAAAIDGVLVEPMAPLGVEMIVGVVRDPTFGPIVTVGAGGVIAELIKDVVRLQGPLNDDMAVSLLRLLRTFPLLAGYRGSAPADLGALTKLVAQISMFAARHGDDIAEIELNPVIVHKNGHGVTVVDALIVIEPLGKRAAAAGLTA